MARILVTGAAGFLGRSVLSRLAGEADRLVGLDVRPLDLTPAGCDFRAMDVRDRALLDLVRTEAIDRVIHLAAIVEPRPEHTREFLESVDVGGTRNVLEACVAGDVSHLTVTSSGAAYGYHADNPDLIDELDPLRGNPEFAYSHHKRQVEELLAKARSEHPHIGQLVLRPGTVLGASVDNQITRLFERPVVLGLSGSDSPFVFIWDADAVEVIARGSLEGRTGIYNLAGSGTVTLPDLAGLMGKRLLRLPAWLVKAALAIAHPLRLAPYGPEQVDFLRHRPVLANRRLIEEFGYTPRMTSRQALLAFLETRG